MNDDIPGLGFHIIVPLQSFHNNGYNEIYLRYLASDSLKFLEACELLDFIR